MIAKLELRLLGAPQIWVDGRPLEGFVTRKALALFIYLALNRHPYTRDGLAGFFWSDVADLYARNSLRRILPNLRDLVGDYLRIDRNTLAFDENASYWIDVDEFQNSCAVLSAAAAPLAVSRLEKGLHLYQGDFLASFVVRDAPLFEEWVLLQREHLRTLAIQGFTRLAEHSIACGDTEAGLDATKRLLAIEPWCEIGHQQRMMLLAHMGQRTAALAQYETCRTILADEFATEPPATMTALYQQIKAGMYERGAALPMKPSLGIASLTHAAASAVPATPLMPTPTTLTVDWGEIPRPMTFRGRAGELAQLRQWLVADQCALVTVVGVGGVGKTTLVAQLVRSLAQATGLEAVFERIIWRSLVNAPPLAVVMRMWLQTLTDQQVGVLPTTLDEQLALLFEQLRQRRCLLVLDNLESILQGGEYTGQFRPGYEEYAQLVQRFGEVEHRSCLLLTSRELPPKVVRFEHDYLVARTLHLDGVTVAAGIGILQAAGLYGAAEEMAVLVERYSGNPLALKLVAETIVDHYQGDTTFFLKDETLLFDDIRGVLAQQFSRITAVERDLLIWLAIEREPVTSSAAGANFAKPPARHSLLEAQRSLYRRSLVEQQFADEPGSGKGEIKLSLQNVVLEYVTDTLLETLDAELESEMLDYFLRYALVKAQAKEYIQAIQQRLLLQPLAQSLQQRYGAPGVAAKLQQLLNQVRQQATLVPGYAAANLLHLALALGIKLRGWDFSQLVIWQADLRTAAVAGINFQGAELRAATFAEAFGIVRSIAISPDGCYLAAGGSAGSIFLWQVGEADCRLHRVLQGHMQSVGSITFAPQGALLASGGFDGRVCLWNVVTGEPVAMRLVHTNTITGLAFSPDGHYIASGGADRRISLWDWQRNELCHSLEETAWINSLVFSPDGRLLIVAKDDKVVNIWDWRAGTIRQTLCGHVDKILAVACNPDGTLLATGGEDRRICLWQLADSGAQRLLGEHKGWVWSLAFSPDGASLVSASADQTVRLWDVATGRVRRTLIGHTGWACAVAYSPDGSMIASGGYDQTIRLWDERSGLVVRKLYGHLSRVDRVVFSEDGALLASSSLAGPIQLWDVRSRQHLHRLVGHGGAIRALAFSARHQVIAGGCDDQRVYLWDTENGELQQTLLGHTDLVRYVVFSPDGHYLVTGSYDRTLRIWEVATGRLCHIVHHVHAKIQSPIVVGADGALLAFGSYDSSIKLLDVGSGTVVESLPIDREEPVVVTFSPQGQLLVCATNTGGLWVWEVDLGRTHAPITLRLRTQTTIQTIWRLLCSSNDQLAVCGDDGAIQIFDLVSGALAYALAAEANAFSLAFSREGRRLVTLGAENTLLIRAAATGQVCRTLRGHLAGLTALTASPAEDMIASSSADGIVQLWSMDTGDCLATLEPVRPYAGMNISGVTGISATQRAMLVALGALSA